MTFPLARAFMIENAASEKFRAKGGPFERSSIASWRKATSEAESSIPI